MNLTILKYTLLYRIAQLGRADFAILCVFMLGGILIGLANQPDLQDFLSGFIMNPTTLLFLSFAATGDFMKQGTNVNEYFSVLFTRPLRRVSYVFTKAVVAWLITLVLMAQLLTPMAFGLMLAGSRQPIVSGWDVLTLTINAFSFSCLAMLLRSFPPRVGILLLLVCLGGAAGTGFNWGVKVETAEAQTLLKGWEAAALVYYQFLFPAIDAQVVFQKEPFSISPLVAYASNCLIYLLGATFIFNRREFSYAQD